MAIKKYKSVSWTASDILFVVLRDLGFFSVEQINVTEHMKIPLALMLLLVYKTVGSELFASTVHSNCSGACSAN
jgi:hypothetical protein